MIMKIAGRLADTLVNMHPEVCRDCLALKKGTQVSHVEIPKAICRMSEATSLRHQ